MSGRNAIFVAGDENIFFPALVALDSIIKLNPNQFDPYICFDADKLTDEMVKALDHHKITFLDSKKLGAFSELRKIKRMREGRWPVEVLLNWALPEYFATQGYNYSIKVDYDILCINPYDPREIFPQASMVKGLLIEVDYNEEGLSSQFIEKCQQKGIFDPTKDSYINGGFVAFNNKLCCEFRFFQRYLATYKLLTKYVPDAVLIEQLALSLTLSTYPDGVESISSAYNHRVRWGVLVDDDLRPTAKNIHYITAIKPWKDFDRTKVQHFVNEQQGILFFYRAIWLEQASKSPWFSSFCNQPPMSNQQILGLSIVVTHKYDRRIRELERKIQRLEEQLEK